MVKTIKHQDQILAVVIEKDYKNDGIEFFTPSDFSQQLGLMTRKKGYVIGAHVHNPAKREVSFTKEVLIVRKGKVRVDFYDDQQNYLDKSIVICEGDVILLAYGGHGFEVLEDCEMVEVKQGPHVGEQDKTRFDGIETSTANIIEIKKI